MKEFKREDLEVKVLMKDGLSYESAVRSLNNGTVVYDNFVEYAESEIEAGCPIDEISSLSDIIKGKYNGIRAVKLDDHLYIISYSL